MYDSWHSVSIESLATGNGKGKDCFMNTILRALKQAFDSLLRLRMFWLIVLPPLVSSLGLFMVFAYFWSGWTLGLGGFLDSLSIFQWLREFTGLVSFSMWAAVVFLILLFIPLVFLSSLLLTALFVMPVVLSRVSKADFPHLEKKRGGSLIGSLWNTLWVTAVFTVAFVVTLPLWLVPGFQILVPLVLTAWLNKKIFLYDVLQDFASEDERKRIEQEEAGPLYGMGLLLGLLSYIPLAIFLIPVMSALSYTYFGLNALVDRRGGES